MNFKRATIIRCQWNISLAFKFSRQNGPTLRSQTNHSGFKTSTKLYENGRIWFELISKSTIFKYFIINSMQPKTGMLFNIFADLNRVI